MAFIKKIHYCWLGSPLPETVKRQVESWKQLCPDYEFIEWNDSNISENDFPDFPLWAQRFREKRWGFASDIVKFNKLYEHGGFYLDCDVIMKKPLDSIPADGTHLLMGYMYDCAISAGFFYTPPGHPLMAKFLDYYRNLDPGPAVVSNTIITDCINNNVPSFLLNGRKFVSEEHKLTIFPKEYFCQPSFLPNKSYVLDQFAGSWKEGSKGFITNRGSSFIRTLRRKVNLFRTLLKNEFRRTYFHALFGHKLIKPETWRLKHDSGE